MFLSMQKVELMINNSHQMISSKLFSTTLGFSGKISFKIFFPGKKTRGCYMGDNLNNTDIDTLVITKTLFSRLMGQAYKLDGTFLSPVRCCFTILFNMISTLSSDWDIPITDQKVLYLSKNFLKVLKTEMFTLT